jgi:hypothetical protein
VPAGCSRTTEAARGAARTPGGISGPGSPSGGAPAPRQRASDGRARCHHTSPRRVRALSRRQVRQGALMTGRGSGGGALAGDPVAGGGFEGDPGQPVAGVTGPPCGAGTTEGVQLRPHGDEVRAGVLPGNGVDGGAGADVDSGNDGLAGGGHGGLLWRGWTDDRAGRGQFPGPPWWSGQNSLARPLRAARAAMTAGALAWNSPDRAAFSSSVAAADSSAAHTAVSRRVAVSS